MSTEPNIDSADLDPAESPPTDSPPRKRHLLLKFSIALLLLIVAVVALAPTIAGKIAPGIIVANLSIPGTVEIGGASFGWFSSQKIGPIVIRERDAKPGAGDPPVATVTLTIAKGLTGLIGAAMGSFDFGVVEVTGGADIVRHADGSTNLERALRVATTSPRSSPGNSGGSSQPTRIPTSLNATLKMTKLRVTFTDERRPSERVTLDDASITATISAANGGNADVTLAAKAAQGPGSPAVGSIAGTLKATGWVKSDGTPAPDLATIDATIALRDVPSAIADAFITNLPGNATLAHTLGPTIALTAAAKGTTKGAVDASILIQAANVQASGEFALANKVLQLSKPFAVHVKGDAARALAPQLEPMLAPSGSTPASTVHLSALPDLVFSVDSLRLPLDLSKAGLDLRGASIDASLGTGGETRGTVLMSAEPGASAQEFIAGTFTIRLSAADLAKGVTLKGGTNITIGGQPAGELAIDLLAKNLLDSRGAFVSGLPVISGAVRLDGVSTALAQPLLASGGLDLVQDLGPTLDVAIIAKTDIAMEAVGAKGGAGAASGSVDVRVTSRQATLATRALISDAAIHVESLQASVGITPATFQRLSPGSVRLSQPVTLSVALGRDGLHIPVKNGMPDPRHATPLELSISSTDAGMEGLTVAGEGGAPRALGKIGVEGLAATIRADLGGLLPDPTAIPGTLPSDGGIPGKAQLELTGLLKGPQDQSLGRLRASASAPFRSGFLADAIKAGVSIDGLSPEVAQSILPEGTITPGMLAGALGSSVRISVDAAIVTPGKDLRSLDAANSTAKVVVNVSGERVATVMPIAFDALKDRITLTSPGEIRLSVDPAWVNATFLSAQADQAIAGTPAKSLTLLEPASIVLTLDPLSIARPTPEVGPLRPGVFQFGLDLRVPRAILRQANGTRLEVLDLDVKAAHPSEATDGTINAAVTGTIAAASGDASTATPTPFALAISISKISSASGTIDLAQAVASVSGDLPQFPASLLDLLAHQNGSLAEFIGESADIRLRAQNISLAPAGATPLGTALVDLSVTSPRLSLSTAGRIEDNAFVASAPIEVEVTEVTPRAGAFINAALPALGTIEKRAGIDRPAKVTITNFRFPLDATYERLSGSFDIDPGEARFESSTAFGEILKVVKAHTQGEVGQRLEPLTLAIVRGEIAIPRYNLRLSEFSIGTEGTINLATRSVNVVTWIPFGALSDKVAGTVKLNSGLGSAIGRVLPLEGVTAIPFRTTGTFAKTGTTLDAELMGKNLVDTVRPDKVLERLPGLINDALPRFGGKKEAPPPK